MPPCSASAVAAALETAEATLPLQFRRGSSNILPNKEEVLAPASARSRGGSWVRRLIRCSISTTAGSALGALGSSTPPELSFAIWVLARSMTRWTKASTLAAEPVR